MVRGQEEVEGRVTERSLGRGLGLGGHRERQMRGQSLLSKGAKQVVRWGVDSDGQGCPEW